MAWFNDNSAVLGLGIVIGFVLAIGVLGLLNTILPDWFEELENEYKDDE